MCPGRLIAPDVGEVCAGIKGLKPDIEADNEGEDCTHDDGVAVDFEESSIGRRSYRGDAEEEGYEDQDSVDNCGWHRTDN